MANKALLKIVGIVVLLAFVNGSPTPQQFRKVDTPPGTAGVHASVQSGQFLITNDESYGLKITHSPYISPSEEEEAVKPQTKKLGQKELQNEEAKPSNDQAIYCAGCSPLTENGGQQQKRKRIRPKVQPSVVRGQGQGNPPFETGHKAAAVRVSHPPFETGHKIPVVGHSYEYSLDLQPPSVQGQGWDWWNRQPQMRLATPSQSQQQWGYQPQTQSWNQEQMSIQPLQINEDGAYSFGYSGHDSSRQEQRTADGNVKGSYMYLDPNGRQVQVEYHASPDYGFHAHSPAIPQQHYNPLPVHSIHAPSPVEDTEEVKQAKAQFFEAYNRQLELIQKAQKEAEKLALKDEKKDTEGASAEGENSSAEKKQTDLKTLPEPITNPDPDNASPGVENEPEDEEKDATVIRREEEPPEKISISPPVVSNEQEESSNKDGQQGPGEDGYSFSVVVGGNRDQGAVRWGAPAKETWQYQTSVPQPQPFTVGYDTQSFPYDMSSRTAPTPVSPSYQLSHMVGVGVPYQPSPLGYHHNQQYMYDNQQPMTPAMTYSPWNTSPPAQTSSSSSPGYFYYVSVGGSPNPQYVASSNLFRTNYPTSLKAQLAGGIPPDARHDPQVSHKNMAVVQNEIGTFSNPPVYLDMDQSSMAQPYSKNQEQAMTILGFIPGALVTLKDGTVVSVKSAMVASSGNNGASIRVQNAKEGQEFPFLVLKQH